MNRPERRSNKGATGGVARRLGVAAVALLGLACGGPSEEGFVIGANEVRQETVVTTASIVRIAGHVDGDVVAAGEHVEVSGRIDGNLFVAAKRVEIEVGGVVEGTVQCACERIDVRGEIGGNAYVAAQTAVVSATGHVHGDALVTAADARIDGRIGRDLLARTQDLVVAGHVERDVVGEAARLGVSAPARIGGDVRVEVSNLEESRISNAAVVLGVTQVDEAPDVSKYAHGGWWALQVLQLLAAFVVGLVLARLYPPLFTAPVSRGRRMLADLGLGLLLLVATPIAAVVLVCTIIGLPLGLIGLVTWMVAVYLAGIVVAGRLGNALVRRHLTTSALGLLVGLLVLGILGELPWIGPVVAVFVIIVGFAIAVDVARERLV